MLNDFIFDSHCHLAQYDSSSFLSSPLLNLPNFHSLSVSTTVSDIQTTLSLSNQFPDQIYPAIGLHPWFLHEDMTQNDADLQVLTSLLQSDAGRVKAIGEIGLDFHASVQVNHDIQQCVFEQQLILAEHFSLPVSIHAVKSHPQIQQLLKAHSSVHGVIHGFYGSVELAQSYIRLGFKLGIGPAIFRQPQHNKLLAVVQHFPSEYFLYETDFPNTQRFGIASPLDVMKVMQKVAELRQEPLESLLQIYQQQIGSLFHV